LGKGKAGRCGPLGLVEVYSPLELKYGKGTLVLWGIGGGPMDGEREERNES